MTPILRKTLLACAITAVVESILVAAITEPPLVLLALGPPAFLALIAWRRRTHVERARRIHGIAVGMGTFGIAGLGAAFLMRGNGGEPASIPIAPVAVPLVQWVVILWVWIGIARAEAREKQANTPASP